MENIGTVLLFGSLMFALGLVIGMKIGEWMRKKEIFWKDEQIATMRERITLLKKDHA